jgi:hypothetical protein
VHRFKNVGDTTARMLDSSLPGGQDYYFKAISEDCRRARSAVAARYKNSSGRNARQPNGYKRTQVIAAVDKWEELAALVLHHEPITPAIG